VIVVIKLAELLFLLDFNRFIIHYSKAHVFCVTVKKSKNWKYFSMTRRAVKEFDANI
jgi:hypothetical protein